MNANMSLEQEDEEMENNTLFNTLPSLRMVDSSIIKSHEEEDTIRLVEMSYHHTASSLLLVTTSSPILHNIHFFHPPHYLPHSKTVSLMPFTSTSSSTSHISLVPRCLQRQRHWCLNHLSNFTKPWSTFVQLVAIFLLLILISQSECAVLVSQTAVTSLSSSSMSNSAGVVTNSSSNSSSGGTTRIFNFSQYSVPHLIYPTSAYSSSSPSHQSSPGLEDDLGDLEMPYPFTEDGIFAVGGSLDVCQVCWCNKVDELDCRYRPDQPSEITLIPMLPKRDDRLKIIEM